MPIARCSHPAGTRKMAVVDTFGALMIGIGIDAGYRFSLPYNLYITPWAGIARDLSATEVMVDGKTFADRKSVV